MCVGKLSQFGHVHPIRYTFLKQYENMLTFSHSKDFLKRMTGISGEGEGQGITNKWLSVGSRKDKVREVTEDPDHK